MKRYSRLSVALIAALGTVISFGEAWAQVVSAAAPPPRPETIDTTRFYIDTFVTDVLADDQMSVAIMDISPRSACPSNQYLFLRDEPSWLYTTGRLLLAMREADRIRVSFSCRDGYQVINAIQFLTPPRVVSRAAPQASAVVTTNTQPIALQTRTPPVPGTGAGAARTLPLPQSGRPPASLGTRSLPVPR